jgi:hypothetical protein
LPSPTTAGISSAREIIAHVRGHAKDLQRVDLRRRRRRQVVDHDNRRHLQTGQQRLALAHQVAQETLPHVPHVGHPLAQVLVLESGEGGHEVVHHLAHRVLRRAPQVPDAPLHPAHEGVVVEHHPLALDDFELGQAARLAQGSDEALQLALRGRQRPVGDVVLADVQQLELRLDDPADGYALGDRHALENHGLSRQKNRDYGAVIMGYFPPSLNCRTWSAFCFLYRRGGMAEGAGEYQRRHLNSDRRTNRRLPYKTLRRPESE